MNCRAALAPPARHSGAGGYSAAKSAMSMPRKIEHRLKASSDGVSFFWWQNLPTSFARPLMSRPLVWGKISTSVSIRPSSSPSANCST